MSAVTCVLDAKATVGEGPVWSATEQALYWVDILEPALHRFEPATGATQTWPMPAAVGSFGLRRQGGVVLALRTGFHLFDLRTSRITILVNPEAGQPENRFNDGKVAPDGRFWAGTMHDVASSERQALGALYRLDADGSCHKVVEDLRVSNGLAWSPDGRIMYHSDSSAGTVWAYDYDLANGEIRNRRVFSQASEETGRPDGAAVDAEGYYWSAGIFAGVINRFAPDGSLERQIQLPCPTPTMPCFGGPDLKTLYITSLRENLPQDILETYPQTGGIFSVDVDVPGAPVAQFKG